jgi:hypothetical protein
LQVIKKWVRLPMDMQERIKAMLMEGVTREPEPAVQHALCQVISPIAKSDLPAGQWPRLMDMVCELHGSERSGDREVAAYLLNAVAGLSSSPSLPTRT